MLVLSTHLASNSGSLSASMAPEVFWAKNSSYGSELHARDSCQAPDLCGDPGTGHAGEKSYPGILFILPKIFRFKQIYFFSCEMEIDDLMCYRWTLCPKIMTGHMF
jgi:hypothetical protein